MGKEQAESYKVLKDIISEENRVSHLNACAEAAQSLFSPVELGYKWDFKVFPKTLKQATIPPVKQQIDGFKEGRL